MTLFMVNIYYYFLMSFIFIFFILIKNNINALISINTTTINNIYIIKNNKSTHIFKHFLRIFKHTFIEMPHHNLNELFKVLSLNYS